jgi:hypothetical protein
LKAKKAPIEEIKTKPVTPYQAVGANWNPDPGKNGNKMAVMSAPALIV